MTETLINLVAVMVCTGYATYRVLEKMDRRKAKSRQRTVANRINVSVLAGVLFPITFGFIVWGLVGGIIAGFRGRQR